MLSEHDALNEQKLADSALIEVGTDQRLAELEPFGAMLGACEKLEGSNWRRLSFIDVKSPVQKWDFLAGVVLTFQLKSDQIPA